MKRFIAVLAALCMLCLSAGCGGAHTSSVKLRVVCTLFPQYDFVRQIVGDDAQVTLLLPPGTESHAFEPTPSDVLQIADADLFVYIGDEMETWARGVTAEIDPQKTQVLNVSQALSLQLSAHAEHEDGHAGEGIDPHIWTSPVLAKQMVQLLRDTLMELDDVHAPRYAENAGVLLTKLTTLDETIRGIVQHAAVKTVVCGSRFALRNFTQEYGLSYIAAFDSCTEESEPSAAAVAAIVQAIETQQIPVVFYEELTAPTTANAIAAETGAKAMLFHSCHNVTQEEMERGETYISLMQGNVERLMFALRSGEENL